MSTPPTPPTPPSTPTGGRLASTQDAGAARQALQEVRAALARVVVGQDAVVTGLLTALLVRGHVLLEGVPGVAKTLLVTTLGRALDLDARRVSFTPDLMPADVTGQLILDQTHGGFTFREGPVFTNLLLADELNRTPPRTQAALLEAMQERQVTVDGIPRPLPEPFMVVATQNPIEHEGTYPLPEAQLDRFLFQLNVAYPDRDEELEIVRRHLDGRDAGGGQHVQLAPVAGPDQLALARDAVAAVRVGPEVQGYLVDLVRATRTAPSIELGVSPRGATMLLHAARAHAWLAGRDYLTPDEVKEVAPATLRHRLLLRPELALDGTDVDTVLEGLLERVPVPR